MLCVLFFFCVFLFFFQAEDGIRDLVRSRGLGDVYKRQTIDNEPPTNFTASVGAVTGSSVELFMSANDNSGTIAYTISYSGGTSTVYHLSLIHI